MFGDNRAYMAQSFGSERLVNDHVVERAAVPARYTRFISGKAYKPSHAGSSHAHNNIGRFNS